MKYDLIINGAGPAGLMAAVRAADAGGRGCGAADGKNCQKNKTKGQTEIRRYYI